MQLGTRRWDTLASFYERDPSRQQSDESAFGDDWRAEDAGSHDWRVTYLHNTHELVARRAQDDLASGPVLLLGEFPTPAIADAALDGWDKLEARTLEWAARRAQIGQAVDRALAALGPEAARGPHAARRFARVGPTG
jgi:hypothetical protein